MRHYVVSPFWAERGMPWIGISVMDIPHGLLYTVLGKFSPHRPRWAERRFKKRVRLYIPIAPPPPPPPPKLMWRYSLAFNFIPVHSKYYGSLCQIWRVERDVETESVAYENLVDFLEEFLGYPEGDWWFEVVTAVGSGWQKVPFNKDLIDFKRLVIEDENGFEVASDGYFL